MAKKKPSTKQLRDLEKTRSEAQKMLDSGIKRVREAGGPGYGVKEVPHTDEDRQHYRNIIEMCDSEIRRLKK
jgi:hypothetical protein